MLVPVETPPVKRAAVAAAPLLAAAAGLAALSLFPPGYDDSGVFRHYGSPASTLKSYVSAVYALDETRETAVGNRRLRIRSNRYRGWDILRRRYFVAGKRMHYRAVTFAIARERVWGDRAQILVHEISPGGRIFPYTYDFEREEGLWRMSDMGPGNNLRY